MFIFNFTIKKLFIQPMNNASNNPARKEMGIETPYLFIRIPQKHPVAYPIAATERSKMPTRRAKVIAHVRRIMGAPFCKVLYMLDNVKNVSVVNEKKKNNNAKKI